MFTQKLLIVIGTVLVLSACDSGDKFDTSDYACSMLTNEGVEANICEAANKDQITTQVALVAEAQAFASERDIISQATLDGEVDVVCYDAETNRFGVVGNDTLADISLWTTSRIDGENFQPVVYIASDRLEQPTDVRETLREHIYQRYDTLNISCGNPQLVVTSDQKDRLVSV